MARVLRGVLTALATLAAILLPEGAQTLQASQPVRKTLPTVEIFLHQDASAAQSPAGENDDDAHQQPHSEHQRQVGRKVREALADVGATFIRVHGVPRGLGPRSFAAATRLFGQVSAQEKASLQVNKQGFTRGFVPLGGESGSHATEVKEAFSMGYAWENATNIQPENGLEGHNLWPSTLSAQHEDRHVLQELFSVFVDATHAFVKSTLVHLPGLEDLAQNCARAETISLLRIFHYFGNASSSYGELGCNESAQCIGSSPHTDWGLLTLILIEDQHALDALHFYSGEEWVRVRPEDQRDKEQDGIKPNDQDEQDTASLTFLLNVGDFLALSSRFAIRSPLHRVALSERERYSFVFFAFPNFDAPVPEHDGVGRDASYDEMRGRVSLLQDQSQPGQKNALLQASTFGELIMRKWAQVQRSKLVEDEPSQNDAPPSDERIVQLLNSSFGKGKNPSVSTLSGGDGDDKIISFDRENGRLIMKFRGSDAMCNGKPGPHAQIQGGFASAMLDAVTAQMVVIYSQLTNTVASLEQKTTFLKPVPPNKDLIGVAKVIKFGRSIAFLEAELRLGSETGTLLVTSSTTISLVKLPSKADKKKASKAKM
ncbi:2-oxoglutarate-dependent dioxygenase mpl2 [Hondaea fermentalgiana]|uniref:2-oxoglutarate-dependent dioxygenase mpl2 n=1 Tax=Hondaea fermentalgiana TaxID=2315210 RepID=A0A2R5G1Z5_9STRA|nr:2-oxoglutarate-dependent dioxygenase mpl2 [Hondaea fermentalgiana]|eukprot:GBG24329.1 2-oxoglutarate-dependent dioxygenase mpl2 [Hondaea fermentalgiana]